MKKVLIFLSTAVLLMVSSCTPEVLDSSVQGVWDGKGPAISLGVKSADSPLTKAETETTRPGDDDGAFNENKIYTLDYFIFNVDPVSNTSTEAIIQGRLTFNGIEPTTEELARANATTIDLSEDFDEDNNICYVYTIANLPDAESSPANYFKVENGKLQHVVGSTEAAITTELTGNYSTLQAIEVVTDFKNSLTENGQFKAQKSFVMAGLKGPITLSGSGADEVIVELGRISSKVSLDINVIKMIEQYATNNVTQQEDYKGTWFPNIDHIQIYLNYVNPSGLVSGKYVGREYEIGTYFSYTRYAYKPTINEAGSYTSTSLARYSEDPTSPYYCGEGHEDLVGSIYVDSNGNPVYINGTEYPAFEVTGTPFYSYPTTWKTSDATAPFIKIIIPWVKYNIPEHFRNLSPDDDEYLAVLNQVSNFPESFDLSYASGGTTYEVTATRVTTATAMTSRYGEEFYYKISVPAFLEGETSECALQANRWYMINLDVAVLGSETDDAIMTIDGSGKGLYVVDWSAPDKDLGGDIDGGRYLSTAQEEYVINAINSIAIPVISSHTLQAEVTSVQWYKNGAWSTPTSGHGNATAVASGTDKVTVTNRLNNTVGSDLDCFPYKIVVTITQVNSDGTSTGSLSETITVYQYPSIYIDQKAGGNVMIDGYYGNVNGYYHNTSTGNSPGGSSATATTGNPTQQTPYAPITEFVNTQQTMTVISISSLGNNTTYTVGGTPFTYLIADPRQPSGFRGADLVSHFSGNYNQTNQGTRLVAWTDEEAGAIQVGNTSIKNYIAPRFMIASRWGRMGNWNPPSTQAERFETVQKRCATYQEAGYPAGRWRLPTEAEIMFIANLQRYSLISDLFTSSGPSISASGGVFTVNTNSVGYAAPGNNDGGRSCRCVYDLWYWGDEPVSGAASTYTIGVN